MRQAASGVRGYVIHSNTMGADRLGSIVKFRVSSMYSTACTRRLDEAPNQVLREANNKACQDRNMSPRCLHRLESDPGAIRGEFG